MSDAWNPGIESRIPAPLRHLCTIFRPEHVSSSLDAVDELHSLTGLPPADLVVFRPERLVLHELLIRVTADFEVPTGSLIGDLGVNFREMAQRLWDGHVLPRMPALMEAYRDSRVRLEALVGAALDEILPTGAPTAVPPPPPVGRIRRLFAGIVGRPAPELAAAPAPRVWGTDAIQRSERLGQQAHDPLARLIYRTLARVMSALFRTHGQAWGSPELLAAVVSDIAANRHCSEVLGAQLAPLLRAAAPQEGYALLARQPQPVVINTKGPSAAGKSSLRPLQRRLAGLIGVQWSDFALISPDIWRKQLLEYESLGEAYKYAGSFTADELQIIDQKLDRYMAQKHARGETSHLLIDRFRFDSFAPDSGEAGSNLLTRFGDSALLFFVITPPEQLVERAWQRGLEFGRYKAVDDTLAHAVEAYTGIPRVFFTWVRRVDKRMQFEFLDNSVPFGELPRTVAFGDKETCNILDIGGLLNIERYGRINVNALSPATLYADPALLAGAKNTGFLRRCLETFRRVQFADQSSGRIYLRIESGKPVAIDAPEIARASQHEDTAAGLQFALGTAGTAGLASLDPPEYLGGDEAVRLRTIGQWGSTAPAFQSRKSQ